MQNEQWQIAAIAMSLHGARTNGLDANGPGENGLDENSSEHTNFFPLDSRNLSEQKSVALVSNLEQHQTQTKTKQRLIV